MANQLGNHKNVLGSTSQDWSIILVPALPGLPIHPFLAEAPWLPIPLLYKKPLLWPNSLHRPVFLMAALLRQVPKGKVDLHLSPPVIWLLCVRSPLCLYSFLSFHSRISSFPPLVGLSQESCLCPLKGRKWKKLSRKGRRRQSFPHVLAISSA